MRSGPHTVALAAITLAALLTIASPARSSDPTTGVGSMTKDALLDLLVTGDPTNASIEQLNDHLPLALERFERAHQSDPKDARWAAGVALVKLRLDRPKEAYDYAKKAVKLDPDSAVTQYTLGTAAGRMTEGAGLFAKAGYAKRTKNAFKKAVEIDPDHYPSRVGLAMYYTFAPGIVGGSWSRADEQAEAITKLPGRADDGHAIIALIASQKGDWERYGRAIVKALDAAETQRDRDDIHADAAYVMLNNREDPRAALEHLRKIEDGSVKSTTSYTYVMARAHHKLGEHEQAIPWYEKTIEIRPDAENSPYYLGVCAMEAGDYKRAAGAFKRYIENSPDGEHATEAKRALNKARSRTG